jgi:DNA-binding NtrC family response regulator
LRTTHIECVILTSFDSVFTFLRNIWALAGIRTHHAKTLEQADFLLLATGATVLLSDIATEDCSWCAAAVMVSDHHPLVTMLVMADPCDRLFLEDAPGLGVYGIIWKPIQFDSATKLTRMAHEASLDRRLLRAV